MAKVGDHIVTEGTRRKVGNLIFRLMPNGETWVSRNYNFRNRKFSEAQKSHQSRFQKASAYAKSAAKKHPIYARLAKGTVKSPYNWALSDWFNPPVVHPIKRTQDRVWVLATDNVMVTKVQITILNDRGKVLAKGEATKGKDNWWDYVSTATGKIVTEAWDLAGNVGTMEQ